MTCPANWQYCELASWIRENITNGDRLAVKLERDQKPGHYVHACFVKKFHDSGTFEVTDVEVLGHYDVDIELDNRINIQVWYGQSTVGNNMLNQFNEKSKQHNDKHEYISPLGGVYWDWEQDCKVMKRKLWRRA